MKISITSLLCHLQKSNMENTQMYLTILVQIFPENHETAKKVRVDTEDSKEIDMLSYIGINKSLYKKVDNYELPKT